MPDRAVELTPDVLQRDHFQFIALIACRSLIAVLMSGRRHLVNAKRTSVVHNVRGSRAVLRSARFQTRVPPPAPSHSRQ